MKSLLALCALCVSLAACGLQPLYSRQGGGFATLQDRIEILPIPGKEGYLMRTELADRLGSVPDGTSPVYRLQVVLDDDISGFGVRRGDDSITRERRVLRARYRLIDAASGVIVADATAGSDAGIDVVSSEYATIAAEDRALENRSRVVADEIVAEIAIALKARDDRSE